MVKTNECGDDRCCKEWEMHGVSSCEYFVRSSYGKLRCKYMTMYLEGKDPYKRVMWCANSDAYALKKLEEL